jgi:4-carboxymuconolactone decarboxylase
VPPSITELDAATRALVRLSAVIAAGDEKALRRSFAEDARLIPTTQVEELVLQSYLFCGFPRGLNAAREWRRVAPVAAPTSDETENASIEEWRERGELTCAAVYGAMYDKLRLNVRDLHPALDSWMVVEGYGKVLSRPGLDLPRRELCIVAACAATHQDRQLHSHLHGALNVGVPLAVLESTIDALADFLGPEQTRSVRLLLARVAGK